MPADQWSDAFNGDSSKSSQRTNKLKALSTLPTADSLGTSKPGRSTGNEVKWHNAGQHSANGSKLRTSEAGGFTRFSSNSHASHSSHKIASIESPTGWLQKTACGYWVGSVFIPCAWLTDKFARERLDQAMLWTFYYSRLIMLGVPIALLFVSWLVSVSRDECRCTPRHHSFLTSTRHNTAASEVEHAHVNRTARCDLTAQATDENAR